MLRGVSDIIQQTERDKNNFTSPDLKLMPCILNHAFPTQMTKSNDVDKPGTQYKDKGQLAVMMSQRTDIEHL